MLDLDFRQPVSIDDAPRARQCEWCGKPAAYQLTAQGGLHHNESGCFCQKCSEEFIHTIADTLDRVLTTEVAYTSSVHP